MAEAAPPSWRPVWVGLVLVCAWDALGLDLAVARLMGGAQGFPLRDHWLLTDVLHHGARTVGWLGLLVCAALAWRPRGPWRHLPRNARRGLVLGVAWALLAVVFLKGLSRSSCPWDLAAFGGSWPWVPHWAWGGGDGGPGHCFPAGHASTGFAFMAATPWWRTHHPAWARRWWWASVATGVVLGLAQQWRGAHFTSHTLWTAWLCWATGVAWWYLAQRPWRAAPAIQKT